MQEVESEFKASLTINAVSKEMAGKTNTLTIKNDEGETVYSFKLELGDKPPSGEWKSKLILARHRHGCGGGEEEWVS